MLKRGASMIFPLLFLPLAAQEAQVLPDSGAVPPPVDTITPVPPPKMPFGTAGAFAPTMPKSLNISNFGGGVIEGTQETGIRWKGPGVKITGDNGLEAFADTALVDFKTESVTLEGNVSVYQGNMLQRGQKAVYYYEKKFLDTSGLRASVDPLLLESGRFTVEDRNGKKVFVGENAGITTEDVEDPTFWLRSKKTTIYPGEKIVFNSLRVYAGDVPVFWLPYLSQPLDAELGYHFVPGARSNWGGYLLNTYGIMLGGDYNEATGEKENAWLLSRWHLDLRSRRGIGTGLDLVDTRSERSNEISGLSLYYLNDLEPDVSRSGVPRGDEISENRYRLELKHRQTLDFPDEADWRIDSNLTLLSDTHYLEDFSTREYRTNPAPDNTLGIFRRDDDSLLSLFGRFRLNDFYRADTRLPEIAFDQARGPLFGLPLLHEGVTSFGIIGEQASDPTRHAILNPLMELAAGDPESLSYLKKLGGYERELAEKILALPLGDPQREAIRTQLLDSGYSRFNTYQELSLPLTLGGFFNFTPEAGAGYTRYSSVDGPVDGSDRTYLYAGAEMSVKLSKEFDGIQNRDLGLDGLKHVFQPYAHWSVVSTDDFNVDGPQVDRLTPTTRPRPLDPTRFTAVDGLESWNVMRLGARNRLLTKRDSTSFEWLFMDTYIDAFINDPEGQRNYSNLYNDISWQPLPWMTVIVNSQFPIASNGSGFTDFSSRLRFMPTSNFEFSLGYRQLNGHPVFIDSDRYELQTYIRLSENWGLGTTHVLELDDGTLELEQYTLHRDLGGWVAGVGLIHRDNRREEEYGIVFSLTLKEFPSVSLPFEYEAQ